MKIPEHHQIVVYTEVASVCNSRCVFCPIDLTNRARIVKDSVRDKVVELLALHPDVKFKTFFHVIGEPLLNKRLEDYIRLLSKLPNVEMWMSTNGVLLTDEKLATLQDAGLKNIWFSMFYTKEEEYEKQVRTGGFQTARRHLDNLLSKSEKFDRIHIVTFSDEAGEIQKQIQSKENVSVEISRRLLEWRIFEDYPSVMELIRSAAYRMERKFICVSTEGEVTLHWKDYNFSNSLGNIDALDPASIVGEYARESAVYFKREASKLKGSRFVLSMENRIRRVLSPLSRLRARARL